jgi:hypothetical protein
MRVQVSYKFPLYTVGAHNFNRVHFDSWIYILHGFVHRKCLSSIELTLKHFGRIDCDTSCYIWVGCRWFDSEKIRFEY